MPHLLTRQGRKKTSKKWPASNRNGGRHHLGFATGFASECLAGLKRKSTIYYPNTLNTDTRRIDNAGEVV